MGQILGSENISDLTVTGALTLSLPASIVNIGGQQYRTTAATTLDMAVTGEGGLDTGAIAVTTDYFVYGVLNGLGKLDVVASLANENIGPTGFTEWRLIGAFASDGSSQVDAVYGNTSKVGKPIEASNLQGGLPETTIVGAVQQSLLTEVQFQTEMGNTDWVLMDGQDVTGSRYHTITGNTTVPNAAGRFLRMIGGNAVGGLGAAQGQATAANGLSYYTYPATDGTSAGPGYVGLMKAQVGAYQGAGAVYVNPVNTEDVETRPINMSVNMFVKIN